MSIKHIRIENFKSINRCDIDLSNTTTLVGSNGAGKSNILEAIIFFYNCLNNEIVEKNIFDRNNKFSNQVNIAISYDLGNMYKRAVSNNKSYTLRSTDEEEKTQYYNYNSAIQTFTKKYAKKDHIVNVKMTYIKGIGTRWNIENYDDRKMIRNLFPLYFINTRMLDIEEWSKVWEAVGELGKTSYDNRLDIEGKIERLIEDNQNISERFALIKDIFDTSNIRIKRSKASEFFETLAHLYLSGRGWSKDGRDLNYYSSGTNSAQYIYLLMRLYKEISVKKMKEPLVLIDEPEIGLHPNYIDNLTDSLLITSSELKAIVSTHSPRIVKNILIQSSNKVYKIYKRNRHTHAERIRGFSTYNPNSRYIVTDEHINSYFSGAVLLVEGESELELFQNLFMRELFPWIKKIDVFKATSNVSILNIMHPDKIGLHVPFICLIDADKAFDYDECSNRIRLKKEMITSCGERMMYRNKKEKNQYLYHLHKRVIGMAEGLRIHYFKPYYSCNDPNFRAFLEVLKEYFLRHNTYVFSTTLEGAIVNRNNYEYALSFLQKDTNKKDFSRFKKSLKTLKPTDKVNVLRLAFCGKTDLLRTYKNLQKESPTDVKLLKGVLLGKKTSGWITRYIEGFFLQTIPDEYSKTISGFKKCIQEYEQREMIRNRFKTFFPELYDLIYVLYDTIDGKKGANYK